MIPDTVVEEVRERVDIVAAIGRLVQLRKEGAAFVGRCPFHEEKTGSFKVFPDSRRFKCFGCERRETCSSSSGSSRAGASL